MDWTKTMSRQETEGILREYAKEMRDNLNLRLLCETKQNISLWETIFRTQEILWVEDVVLTEITYPEEKKDKTGNRFKGIREWFRRIKKFILNLF